MTFVTAFNMAESEIREVKFGKVRNPFTKKTSRSSIHKYRRNKNRKLRRKRNHVKYFEQLRELRIKRNSQELCSSVSLINITDMKRESSDKHLTRPPEEVTNWQYHHQLAYWKSRAISLEYENRMLHQHIKNLYTKQIEEYAQLVGGHDEVDEQDNQPQDTEIEEKCEQLRLNEDDEEFEQCRSKEMEDLYGDMAPKINGMETAMKISYDLQVEKYKPPHWPNLPLNL